MPSKSAAACFERRVGAIRLLEEPFDFWSGANRRAMRAARRKRRDRSAGLIASPACFAKRSDVRLPRAALGLDVLEARARLLVRAAAGSDGLRVGAGRLVVVPLVLEHVAELEEEAAGAQVVLHALELELAELLDHVQLPEVPVDRAGVLERLDERGIQLVGVLEVLERLHARRGTSSRARDRAEGGTAPSRRCSSRHRRSLSRAPRPGFASRGRSRGTKNAPEGPWTPSVVDQPVDDRVPRRTALRCRAEDRSWSRLLGEQRYQRERASESPVFEEIRRPSPSHGAPRPDAPAVRLRGLPTPADGSGAALLKVPAELRRELLRDCALIRVPRARRHPCRPSSGTPEARSSPRSSAGGSRSRRRPRR